MGLACGAAWSSAFREALRPRRGGGRCGTLLGRCVRWEGVPGGPLSGKLCGQASANRLMHGRSLGQASGRERLLIALRSFETSGQESLLVALCAFEQGPSKREASFAEHASAKARLPDLQRIRRRTARTLVRAVRRGQAPRNCGFTDYAPSFCRSFH